MIALRLAWRDFANSKLLWGMSAAAVGLGVATIVAADVVSGAVLNAMRSSPDVQTLMGGLTELLGSNLTVMGAAISLASGFVVFNAFGMSLARRRRRIGLLRTAGMTRTQLLRLTLLEALLTGLLGVALGLVAGPLLGALAIAAMKVVTAEGLFLFETQPPSVLALMLAAALGIVVSLVAALAPALAAVRLPPLAGRRNDWAAAGAGRVSLRITTAALAALGLALFSLRQAPPARWLRPPWDGPAAVLAGAIWLALSLATAPGLLVAVGRVLRWPLTKVLGASGLLVVENLRRDRRRVSLTVASLAIALALVISTLAFSQFTGGRLLGPKLEQAAGLGAWSVTSFDPLGGMATYGRLNDLTMKPADIDAVRQTVGDRAAVLEFGFAVVPELSYFGDSYFSFVMDPAEARLGGDWLFSFNQGDWEQAQPVMQRGCGVLAMPPVAQALGGQVGTTVELSSSTGPVECTLAGIGAAFGAASIIGTVDPARFAAELPITLMVRPLPGSDRVQLDRDLTALAADSDGIGVVSMQAMTGVQLDMINQVPLVLDAMAVLAVIAASLGVVNTVTISVVERRREFGLYRAVGATRRQLFTVVIGEAALIAALAGGLGVLGGAGVAVIVPTVYGGASWGVLDLDHWAEAVRILRPALQLGLIGWAATPVIGALAGWLPARALLRRQRLVQELLVERH